MDSVCEHRVTWLDSCLQETLLPSSPWHKVSNIICEKLAGLLESRLDRPEIRQALYELLGDDFVRQYFRSWPDKPMVLELPFMQAQTKREARVLAKQLLSNASDTVLKDVAGSTCVEVQEFEQFCKCLVVSRVNQQIRGTSGDSGLYQSETIGSALACLLQRRPEQLKSICKTIYGRLLPDTLRGCVWSLTLDSMIANLIRIAKKELGGNETVSSVDVRKKRFMETIQRVMDTAAHKSPLKSPISGLIQRSVEQAYRTTLPLSDQLDEMLQWKTVIQNILNCLYIYNKSYEPTHIYLSFPVVLAFWDKKRIENDEHHCVELAWRLHEVVTYCFPSHKAISDMSSDVIRTIQRADERLYLHLVSVTRKANLGQHQEFLAKLAASDSSGQSSVFGPEIFIRKWVTEGFVSVLEYHSVMFIWDQLFLADWALFAMQRFCLAILRLLREQLMAAETFEQLHKVLIREPCGLFLKQVQSGWMKEELSDM
ncbi:uncharacterized protein LOC134181344 isoform X2 [Corticium candelabrum]|nr:uncharacterized protein LOC134181344 isoform X2 [Corticium candelabrum]